WRDGRSLVPQRPVSRKSWREGRGRRRERNVGAHVDVVVGDREAASKEQRQSGMWPRYADRNHMLAERKQRGHQCLSGGCWGWAGEMRDLTRGRGASGDRSAGA